MKYYNVWLHIEKVEGPTGEETYTNLDDDYMPIKLMKIESDKELEEIYSGIHSGRIEIEIP